MDITHFFQDSFSLAVALIFAASFLIQLFYYLFFYRKIAPKSSKITVPGEDIPVSVVICAKNEANNLDQHLPAILEQEHEQYEVIVVDDCSVDHTNEILAKYKAKYPHLRSTHIEPNEQFSHSKKLAITIGIKSAKNEWLLFTDADCQPASSKWIRKMQCHFNSSKEIVLGYGAYKPYPTLINSLIRYDTFFTGVQYLSFARAGLPYMGVGRNLAYQKSLFFRNKGFASHLKLLSGDDDLLVNENARGKNTAVEASVDAKTISEPKQSIKDWTRQKRRHFSTGRYYKFTSKILIGGEFISRLLYYAAFLFLMLKSTQPIIFLYPFIFRFLIQSVILGLNMKKLGEKYLLPPLLIYDIILPIFNFILYIITRITPKRNRW